MDQTLTQVQTNSEEMLNKAYNTEVTNGLERVQEESDYRTFEVFAKKQNGNVQPENSTTEKARPSSKTKIDQKMVSRIQKPG